MKPLDENFHPWWQFYHKELKLGDAITMWLKEQKIKEELKTGMNPNRRSKKNEHKPDNDIRLQITIDRRIL